MEYDFRRLEKDWQKKWKESNAYKVENDFSKPKCYVLDMFPYPSGAGLHVGHPLGYIASDIYSRYKRLKGFNVLHPMGYDAFGLPAEQYAIDHGIHPAISTEANIKNFRSQLDKIGFCFDWDREVNTSKPEYYKWTQWIFLQLFNSFYNRNKNRAESINNLIAAFENEGNSKYSIPNAQYSILNFAADEWKSFDEKIQQDILMQYRLAYCGYGEVNWCEALGTVLANDEIVNGVSERGGYPVVKKKLRQWYLRITEYADRLLEGLEKVEFSEAMKEMQVNWIGKSSGAEIDFRIRIGESVETRTTTYKDSSIRIENISITESESDQPLRVYTTRPDTIFGVDFMVIAPEHELVGEITTAEQKQAVDDYIAYVKSRSERERMAEKKITGVFTGAYALNPFDKREIPIWISEYVLAGYGTGAIMAVPCGDQRDFLFAKYFNISITNIIGKYYNGEEANPTRDAILENSDFINGMVMKDVIEVVISKMEELGIGARKVNYKMRDAAFSRQRYWGEPFPIVWKDGTAYPLDEKELPILLPQMDEIKPGPDGEGPLANLSEWINTPSFGRSRREVNTMPGYAGSSWYFLRYMDPHNDKTFCDRKVSDYWNQVDIYVGGTEHAVGHLLYSRMWTKVLYDLGHIGFDEPYKKLVNQGMIQGSSRFVYRFVYRLDVAYISGTEKKGLPVKQKHLFKDQPIIISFGIYQKYLNKEITSAQLIKIVNEQEDIYVGVKEEVDYGIIITPLHVPVEYVDGVELNVDLFRKWKEFQDTIIIKENDKYICGSEVEKMSKSKFNTVNPDDLVLKYGADTFRMYEMFLGPVEMSKPWDTKGIEGVHRFLKKFWRLFADETKGLIVTNEEPTADELKILHTAIKKIENDTERFSFNTAVSAFMIATNELTDLKCHKKEILEPLLILLAPYAPHIAEELYHQLNSSKALSLGEGLGEVSILNATYPVSEEKYLIESSKEYPISVNGKLRTTINISLDAQEEEVKQIVLANKVVQKWLEGKPPKKVIYVKNKMINVVI